MGSSMQRQALKLEKNEIAIIGTGIEKIVGNLSIFNINCRKSGVIKYINKDTIITHEKINNKKINNKTKKSLFEKIKSKLTTNIYYKKYKKRIYKKNLYTEKMEKSLTILTQKNKWALKGNNFLENKSIKKGISAIGTNLLVAYMIWKGYNFEDAVVINEKLIKKDKLTSIQFKKYKTFILNNNSGNVLGKKV